MGENRNYKLLNIILIESNFKRQANIQFTNPDFNNELNINVEDSKKDNKLFITVTASLEGTLKEENQFSFLTKYVGIFEFDDNLELSIDQFAKINGPAIIFPFIREHIASLSLKAGIDPILLPPINFVHLSSIKN